MAVVEIGLPATPIVPAAGRKRVVPAEEGVKGDEERVVDPVPDRVSVHRRRMSRYASQLTQNPQMNADLRRLFLGKPRIGERELI